VFEQGVPRHRVKREVPQDKWEGKKHMSRNSLYVMILVFIVIASSIAFLVIRDYSLSNQHASTTTPISNGTGSTALFKTFSSMDELLDFLSKHQASTTSLYRVATTMPAATAPIQLASTEAKSTYVVGTNIQVEGIDEGDYVKISDKLVVVAKGSQVYVLTINPPEQLSLASVINLTSNAYADQLFLIGNSKLVIISQSTLETEASLPEEKATTTAPGSEVRILPVRIGRPLTIISVYDVSNPKLPAMLWSFNSTGLPIATRSIGSSVYVVLQEPIYRIMVVGSSGTTGTLPLINNEPPLPSKTFYAPGENYGIPVVLLRIDARTGMMDYSVVFAPPVERVYMSGDNLYLFSTSYEWVNIDVGKLIERIKPYLPDEYRQAVDKILEMTGISDELRAQMISSVLQEAMSKMGNEQLKAMAREIEKFYAEQGGFIGPLTHALKISLDKLQPSSRNKYWGRLLDQFAINEDSKGNLILALTAEKITSIRTEYVPGGLPYIYPEVQSVNRVVISDKDLRVLGSLEDLAPGEVIYSSRFINNMLYLVTYRQIDPLFAVDLSDPSNPRILGYLKVPGFSEYLHPVNSTMLIGVGYSDGLTAKVSLFDVSNPAEPREVDALEIGYSSPVMYDHKAFNYDARTWRALIPIVDMDKGLVGLVVLKIDNGKISLLYKLRHDWCDRGFFINDYVVSVSRSLVRVWLNDKMIAQEELS
jgi:uncharacterized secreted protein with C-terminal beta-propeller domain